MCSGTCLASMHSGTKVCVNLLSLTVPQCHWQCRCCLQRSGTFTASDVL